MYQVVGTVISGVFPRIGGGCCSKAEPKEATRHPITIPGSQVYDRKLLLRNSDVGDGNA